MQKLNHISPPQRSNTKCKGSKEDSISEHTLLFGAAGVQESALGHFSAEKEERKEEITTNYKLCCIYMKEPFCCILQSLVWAVNSNLIKNVPLSDLFFQW